MQTVTPNNKRFSGYLVIFASVSSAYVLTCAVFELRYFWDYGFLPYPDSQPQATAVNYNVLDALILVLLLAQFLTVPLCLALLSHAKVSNYYLSLLVRLYTLLAIGTSMATSFGGFLDWYFD